MKPARSFAKATRPDEKKPIRLNSAVPPSASMVTEYMPLVHQVVARFLKKLPPNVLRDDLVAAGTFGLIDALRKSGSNAGPTFEWYARIRIRGAILDELRTQDWLTRRARNKVTATAAASPDELPSMRAAVVGFDDLPPDVRARNFTDEAAASPLDLVEESMARESLSRAIEELPERERCIVKMHYFQGVPFKTIASTLNVSEPRISQLHARAMTLLRTIIAKTAREEAA